MKRVVAHSTAENRTREVEVGGGEWIWLPRAWRDWGSLLGLKIYAELCVVWLCCAGGTQCFYTGKKTWWYPRAGESRQKPVRFWSLFFFFSLPRETTLAGTDSTQPGSMGKWVEQTSQAVSRKMPTLPELSLRCYSSLAHANLWCYLMLHSLWSNLSIHF